MAFPSTEQDTFPTRLDRHSASAITDEAHTVPSVSPYRIYLDELPDIDTVVVSGYTVVSYQPTLATHVQVDYASASLIFHSGAAGANVLVTYSGLGSVVRAEDFNDMQTALQNTQKELFAMLAAIAPCRLMASDPASTTLTLRAGTYYIQPRIPITITAVTVDLTTGDYQVGALPAAYYCRLIFTLNADGVLTMYAGTPASTANAAVFTLDATWADAHPSEILVASVLVQDDGSAVAGSVLSVAQTDITDLRPSVQLGAAGESFMQEFVDPADGVRKIRVITSLGDTRAIL